jgi:sulfopyruvate decarboxylase subunit beta
MMKRDQALSILARHYPDGIVVPVYQSAFDWLAIRPHPLNYLCTGAMGQASSHGLGLALGAPDEKVVILDGDGSLLMNLGSLVTIANLAPRNLIHFVINNGVYEVNGNFPIPGDNVVDFEGLAREAGYAKTYGFSDLDVFESKIDEILTAQGPVFVCLKAEIGGEHPKDYAVIHSAQSRQIFREALRSRLFS